MVDEGALAVCIYNPAAVNPFPLPPSGVDLPRRYELLRKRGVTLYVISGLAIPQLQSWLNQVGLDIHALSDADGEMVAALGIPIKRVEGRNFRTHVGLVLQEDRILSILPETDPVHRFEELLTALDVAADQKPQTYDLPDKPWYASRHIQAEIPAEDSDTGFATDDSAMDNGLPEEDL